MAKNPVISKIRTGIGAIFGQQQGQATATSAQSPPLGNTGPKINQKQGEELNLINYAPEEVMQHVEQSLSGVHFGMSTSRKIKEYTSEIWSVLAPIVLCTGTVGEVYFFISSNMAKGKDGLSWWVVWSIIATILALEVSFMVVSMKSDTIRNDHREKGVVSPAEQKELFQHRVSWFVLASGVAIGQISFLVVSLAAGLHDMTFIIAFSVGRSVFTLAADFYVAFVHKAMPTTAEQQDAMQVRRGKAVVRALEQKSLEITTLNDGQLRLRAAHAEAQAKDVELKTMLEVKKLQSQAQIDTLKNGQKQNAFFQELQNAMTIDMLHRLEKQLPYTIEEQKDRPQQLKGL
jgi:hypothetical protein